MRFLEVRLSANFLDLIIYLYILRFYTFPCALKYPHRGSINCSNTLCKTKLLEESCCLLLKLFFCRSKFNIFRSKLYRYNLCASSNYFRNCWFFSLVLHQPSNITATCFSTDTRWRNWVVFLHIKWPQLIAKYTEWLRHETYPIHLISLSKLKWSKTYPI